MVLFNAYANAFVIPFSWYCFVMDKKALFTHTSKYKEVIHGISSKVSHPKMYQNDKLDLM